MSTNTELTVGTTTLKVSSAHVVEAAKKDQCISPTPLKEIKAIRKEYSIVGDAFYAGVNSDVVPSWLSSLIDSTVNTSVNNGLSDYDLLVQDVRSAVDSIDVASNTYVEEINFSSRVDGIVGSHLTTLNASIEGVYATKVALDTVKVDSESALATSITDLQASFTSDINSRITTVENAFASADSALAGSITALTVAFADQESNLAGTADAVSGLQTYVGLDPNSENPTGSGILGRLLVVEKQSDGVIETISDVYDVILNPQNPSTAELVVSSEPYASWVAADVAAGNSDTRLSHIGDVYIKYATTANGAKEYIASYKFIKAAVDNTSPYSTDSEGFTWSVIIDQAAQDAYEQALNAYDLADGKRRVFVETPVTPYERGDLWVDSNVNPQIVKVATSDVPTGSFSSGHWALADEYAKDFVDNTYTPDSEQLHRQLDGKVEYYYYESFSDVATATNEATALSLIDDSWTTQALKDAANGNIVYFKDSKNAYSYQGSNNVWEAVTDTSIYEALQHAALAQGAADGKISQFFAWGGGSAPQDYTIVTRPVEYLTNENFDFLDINGDVTTTPAEYVLVQAEQTENIEADNFVYWFLSSVLYRKTGSTWTGKEAVPSTSGNGTYMSEGDVLTVVDPVNNDSTVYTFNGTSWVVTGPEGIISKSKFFVDLNNAVSGPTGLTKVVSNLEITSSAYTDSKTTEVESKFSYDSSILLGGSYYNSGFGLDSSGVTQSNDGTTPETAFDSEFWVNAERFVLKSPSYPGVSASFTVTASGIKLGLDNTEATRNEAAGDYATSTAYLKGDMVSFDGASYLAVQNVPSNINDLNNATYWQLLADRGIAGSYTDFLFIRKSSTPVNPGGADTWVTDATAVSAGAGDLWTIKKSTDSEGSVTYSDKRIIDFPIVREITIYSDVTTGTLPVPNGSTYNLSNSTLTINDPSWNLGVPSLTAKNQKVYVCTALVTGNNTETSKSVNWSTASVYAQRTDGVSYTGTVEYYKVTNSATAPSRYSSGTTIDSGWLTTPSTPTSNNQYLWNFNRNSKSDTSFSDSPVSLITQYVKDGRGIDSISEAYQLGTSATIAPTGTWVATFSGAGAITSSLPYMWNRTTVVFTDGSANHVTTTMIAAKGDDGESGSNGSHGSGSYVIKTTEAKATTEAIVDGNVDGSTAGTHSANLLAAAGRPAQNKDILSYVNDTAADESLRYRVDLLFNGSTWEGFVLVVDGNQIVHGTIAAEQIVSDIIFGTDATFTGTLRIGGTDLDADNTLNDRNDPAGSASAAQTAAVRYSDSQSENFTLYSWSGEVSDIMPTGSPLPLGYYTSVGKNIYSDYIPVRRGEILDLEVWAKRTSGSPRAYMGLQRYDRNKKPLNSNSGTVYTGLVNTAISSSWTKYKGSLTMPTTHTPYDGSDGAEVCFVRVRFLMNYNTTGNCYYSGFTLTRRQDKGRVDLGNVDNTSDATVLLSAASAANSADKNAGTIAGWAIDSNYIWSGTKKTSDGYSTSGITLNKDGSLRSPKFYIDGGTGNAYFKGDISLATGTLTAANIVAQNISGDVTDLKVKTTTAKTTTTTTAQTILSFNVSPMPFDRTIVVTGIHAKFDGVFAVFDTEKVGGTFSLSNGGTSHSAVVTARISSGGATILSTPLVATLAANTSGTYNITAKKDFGYDMEASAHPALIQVFKNGSTIT